MVEIVDNFNGDTEHLRRSIKALIELDEANALVPHGVGGHAKSLLSAAYTRLAQQSAATGGEGLSNIVESEGLCRFDPGSDTAVAEVKALGGSTPPSTATRPNDMARENERLKTAAAKVAESHREFAMSNLECQHRPAHYAGYRDAAIQIAAGIRLLSTTPSNPPAPSDARMRINRWLSDGVGYEKIDAAFRNDLRAALTNPAGEDGMRDRALEEAAQIAGDAFWNLPMPKHWDRDKQEYKDWCARQSKFVREQIAALSATGGEAG